MSFGYRDAEWVDPDPRPDYEGSCCECRDFIACPCGCDWGVCLNAEGEFVEGSSRGCPEGSYAEEAI